ncbi:MAG: glutamyl-tRNA(Gln) amidotransferase subunit E [Patescibacteria group bacterium]|jgi:glutamyl-tRNA(Gln) amidotransferase subunit E
MVGEHTKLGLKAGLEIHQQLDTHKLFCSCPSILRNDEFDFEVERVLNPVVGETGVVDVAAAYEAMKAKRFTYRVFDTNCLVELDEEPPHNLNPEALEIGLEISLLLNAEIFPVSQIMRKTVIDGSNTSGFQRTVLIAHDGYIETSEGKVRIETIAIEEDSGRKVSDSHGKRVYSLDRLGIPLVEITTAPDLGSPEQIKEAALQIGEILRACRVRRGIGTIRQDVNISIAGGNRVEIKGFQDAKIMLPTVDNEMIRQKNLLELASHFKDASFSDLENVSEIFSSTTCNFISKALDNKKEKLGVYGFRLDSLSGIIGKEIIPGKRIGTDLSDFAKPVSGIGGIIHSDETLEKYSFTEGEITSVHELLRMKKDDAFILIIGTQEQASVARDAIIRRISLLSGGVPKEVRQSQPDATTVYLRPMPGSARMYPETDVQLLKIKRQQIDSLKTNLPKLASEHKRYLQTFGVNDELISLLFKRDRVADFSELVSVTDHYGVLAKALTIYTFEIASKLGLDRDGILEVLHTDIMASIFEKLPEEITESEIKPIMMKIANGKTLEEAMEKSTIDLSNEVSLLISEKPGLSAGAYMGLIMKKFTGQVGGNEVMKELQKQLA